MIFEKQENFVPNMLPGEFNPTFTYITLMNFGVPIVITCFLGFLKNHPKFKLKDIGKHIKFCAQLGS